MKRNKQIRILFGILYVVVITIILLLQVHSFDEAWKRVSASAGTLLLAIPAVLLLIGYIRLTNQEDRESRTVEREENSSQNYGSDATVTEVVDKNRQHKFDIVEMHERLLILSEEYHLT